MPRCHARTAAVRLRRMAYPGAGGSLTGGYRVFTSATVLFVRDLFGFVRVSPGWRRAMSSSN